MEVLSKQIFGEMYEYLTQNTGQPWYPIKGRPDMTLEIVNTSIYNASARDMSYLFIMLMRGGNVHRLDYAASVGDYEVWRSDESIYLAPGDEYGFQIIGGAVNDKVQIAVNGIMWSDKDILTKALDSIGLKYVIREKTGGCEAKYSYVFLGIPESARGYHGDNFETTDLDTLLMRNDFIEFENGSLASY